MELEGNYLLNDKDINQDFLHDTECRIRANTYVLYSECLIYSYKLAALFMEDKIELYEQNSESVKPLIGWKLFDIYEAAYKEGLTHFDTLYPNIDLYGKHLELIIDSLHRNCYHTLHNEYGLNQPWMWIIKKQPFVLSTNVLRKYGFYSGILSKVYELTKNHAVVFKEYDNGNNCIECRTKKNAKLDNFKKSETGNLEQKTIALIHYYLYKSDTGKAINSANANEIAANYGYTSENSGKKLLAHFDLYREETNRLKSSGDKRGDNKMKKRFDLVISYLKNNNELKAFPLAINDQATFLRNIS